MKHSLLERLVILVGVQVENAKTETEKAEYLQLLEELKKEKENESQKLSDNFFWSLLKNVATHEVIEFLKNFLSG